MTSTPTIMKGGYIQRSRNVVLLAKLLDEKFMKIYNVQIMHYSFANKAHRFINDIRDRQPNIRLSDNKSN